MLNRLDLRGVPDPSGSLPRPQVDGDEPVAAVRSILAEVRNRGDAALIELTERFDGVVLERVRVPAEDIDAALAATPDDVRAALELARDRIRAHHETQLRAEVVHDTDGVHIRSFHRPVDRVGCYVPGGRAAYPSTLLMTAVPAQVAGVPEVAVCVPPDRDTGRVTPVTLAAAAVAGVDEVYAIGGAQAIGALAYGTEQVPAVDVICGPGNKYVALAKQEVAGTVGVAAAFAGPSEVVVIADGTVRPELAAVDVILQAEHGPDGLAWLISWDSDALDAIDVELARLTEAAPRRAEITATLADGCTPLVDSPAAVEVANQSPRAPRAALRRSRGPGRSGPQRRGDLRRPVEPSVGGRRYVAGAQPRAADYGTARFSSALTVDDFLKQHHHVITVDGGAFVRIGPAVQSLAEAEGRARRPRRVDRIRRPARPGDRRPPRATS